MAFAVTCSYQTFSSQRRHCGQEAPLLQLFNGPFNFCKPPEPPLGAATFPLDQSIFMSEKLAARLPLAAKLFLGVPSLLSQLVQLTVHFRKIFLDPVLAYISVTSCVANPFHFYNYLLTTTSKPRRRLSAMDKVAAIDKINDEKHMLVDKLSFLPNCLRLKPGNIFHARLWLEFILSPRMPHADFACSLESSVVHV